MGDPYSKVIVVIIAVSVYVVAVIITTFVLIYAGDDNITKTQQTTTKESTTTRKTTTRKTTTLTTESIHRMIYSNQNSQLYQKITLLSNNCNS